MKLNKKLFLSIISLLISSFLFGQQNIKGKIIDEYSKQPLIGANIVFGNSNTLSDSIGEFDVVALQSDTFTISYIGYGTKVVINSLPYNLIEMRSNSERIDEVTIIASRINKYEIGRQNVLVSEINNSVFLLGENDPLKMLQTLPGIKYGIEGTSGIIVRGGGPDQNLYLMDNVPVYGVNHMFGLISTFNTSTIKELSIYKGIFPARYSGRLSSVLDFRMDEGSKSEYKANIGIGILSAKLNFNGPIIKDKWTINTSVRRSMLDYTIARSPKYYFIDGSLKSTFAINSNHKLSINLYNTKDSWVKKGRIVGDSTSTTSSSSQLNWKTKVASLSWENNIGKLNNLITIFNTGYIFNTSSFDTLNLIRTKSSASISNNYTTEIQDNGIKLFSTYKFNKYTVSFGSSYISHFILPGTSSVQIREDRQTIIDSLSNQNSYSNRELNVFLENEFRLDNFKLNLGINFFKPLISNFKTKNYLEPRFSLEYKFFTNTYLQLGYSRMNQNLHQLSNNSLGLPSDIWIASSSRILPANSENFAISFSKDHGNYEWIVESFFKTFENLMDYGSGTSFLLNGVDWEDKIQTNGKGGSKGVEFYLRKKAGKLSGWVSYTISKTHRQFENINKGEKFPYKFDRRHEFNIVGIYNKSKKLSFSFNWSFSSGNKYSRPIGYYPSINYTGLTNSGIGISTDLFELPSIGDNRQTDNNVLPIFDKINNASFPYYHRLDVSMRYKIKKKSLTHQFEVGAYNIYNRHNTLYVSYSADVDLLSPSTQDIIGTKSNSKLRSIAQFPIIPSLSYNLSF